MLLWWTNATTLVRSLMSPSASAAARSSRPSSVSAEPAQRGPGPLARELPRHQVGVVLHLRDDDLVARPQPLADGAGQQVQPLGDVLGEDDLARVGGAEEGRHLLAGTLVERGRFLGEGVNPAVNIGVVTLVVVALGVQHGQRLLAGRRAVEVDQRHAVVDPSGAGRIGKSARTFSTSYGQSVTAASGAAARSCSCRFRHPVSRVTLVLRASAASSAPPESTMRPPAMTWTKSGVM